MAAAAEALAGGIGEISRHTSGRWYGFVMARSRPTNPARRPVGPKGRRSYIGEVSRTADRAMGEPVAALARRMRAS